MKGKTLALALLAAVSAGYTGTATAQQDPSTRAASPRTIPPDAVIGWPVMNRAGEEVGTVDGIVRDRSDMRNYALVDVGEFLAVGERSILVPLDSLRVGANNTILMSQGDSMADLKKAPEWNRAAGDYDVRFGDAARPDSELRHGAKPDRADDPGNTGENTPSQ